jgi:hypothetical protein
LRGKVKETYGSREELALEKRLSAYRSHLGSQPRSYEDESGEELNPCLPLKLKKSTP